MVLDAVGGRAGDTSDNVVGRIYDGAGDRFTEFKLFLAAEWHVSDSSSREGRTTAVMFEPQNRSSLACSLLIGAGHLPPVP